MVRVGQLQQQSIGALKVILKVFYFEMYLDPCRQLKRIEGFGDVVAGPLFKSLDLAVAIIRPCQDENRYVLKVGT